MKVVSCLVAVAMLAVAPIHAFVVSNSLLGACTARRALEQTTSTSSRSTQPVMLFGGGAKPPEGGAGDKKEGGFNMGNMMEGLKKANEIGQKTKDLQKDLEVLRVEGTSPCGMVKVTLSGQQMPVSCEISEEAMAEGAKAVSEKVTAAMTTAHQQSLQTMSKKLAELYAEMGLPLGQQP